MLYQHRLKGTGLRKAETQELSLAKKCYDQQKGLFLYFSLEQEEEKWALLLGQNNINQ